MMHNGHLLITMAVVLLMSTSTSALVEKYDSIMLIPPFLEL